MNINIVFSRKKDSRKRKKKNGFITFLLLPNNILTNDGLSSEMMDSSNLQEICTKMLIICNEYEKKKVEIK